MKELVTNRLKLRYIKKEDAPTIYENWASDPEVARYVTWKPHECLAVTEAVVDFWVKDYKNSDCYRYGIERKLDNELMGMIDVVGYHHCNPVIGYCMGKRFWNNGYMTEALEALVNQLISDGYKVIVIEAVKDNIGSNRVIEKNGFKLVESRESELSSVKPEMVTINSYRYYAETAIDTENEKGPI